ncbi:MAG: signal peptidase II [Brevefilum sp.]|nr:signal peptidase II [Brevefilum sp.]
MKKLIKTYGLLVLVVSVVIVLDQITKYIVRINLPFGSSWTPIAALPFFRIVHWLNTGAAFGMFQGGGLIFGILAVIVTLIIVLYYPKIPREYIWMRIAIAMQMGGALGNLIDRLLFGPVTDFIAVGTFPVFNIADASITVGVGILLLNLWLLERKEKAAAAAGDQVLQDSPETLGNRQS